MADAIVLRAVAFDRLPPEGRRWSGGEPPERTDDGDLGGDDAMSPMDSALRSDDER